MKWMTKHELFVWVGILTKVHVNRMKINVQRLISSKKNPESCVAMFYIRMAACVVVKVRFFSQWKSDFFVGGFVVYFIEVHYFRNSFILSIDFKSETAKDQISCFFIVLTIISRLCF